VSRDDLHHGADLLGLSLEDHAGNVIEFMRERAEALGLKGSL
jgi:predicted hydrolase (HD superfamily)